MSETIADQGYYDQERAGDSRSLYGDMIRSRDFGEQSMWPTEQLLELGHYWTGELHNPERSPRALGEIDKLIARAAFELVGRQNDLIKQINQAETVEDFV